MDRKTISAPRGAAVVVTPMFGLDFSSTHTFADDVTYASGDSDGRSDKQHLLPHKLWKCVHTHFCEEREKDLSNNFFGDRRLSEEHDVPLIEIVALVNLNL